LTNECLDDIYETTYHERTTVYQTISELPTRIDPTVNLPALHSHCESNRRLQALLHFKACQRLTQLQRLRRTVSRQHDIDHIEHWLNGTDTTHLIL
jgi:hypothetical protein